MCFKNGYKTYCAGSTNVDKYGCTGNYMWILNRNLIYNIL